MANAQAILIRHFWKLRWRCLSLAAGFGPCATLICAESQGSQIMEAHLQKLRKAIGVLLDENADRAERVQMITAIRPRSEGKFVEAH